MTCKLSDEKTKFKPLTIKKILYITVKSHADITIRATI